MSDAIRCLEASGTQIAAVMQTMVDYKLDETKINIADLIGPVADLRADYQHHGFGKGDKLATNVDLPRGGHAKLKGVLPLELTGGALGKFHRYLDIPINHKRVPLRNVRTLHGGLSRICRMYPGGNAPNETRNMVQFMEAGIGPQQLELYSSTDALFEQWYRSITPAIRDRVHRTILQMDDGGKKVQLPSRMGLHLPCGDNGTISIANPATSTVPYIRDQLQSLLEYDQVIVSEGLCRAMLASRLKGRKNLVQKINPSSAFRGDCAIDAYEYCRSGGASPIVTMNDDEFDYYVRCIKGRIEEEEPEKLDPIPFLSPFDDDGALDHGRVRVANNGFNEYFRYIRTPRTPNLTFPLNVSSGKRGGYHVAVKDGRLFVAFSTTPHTAGTRKLLRVAGDPPGVGMRIKKSMGAGDSLGALLSLANVWDTEEFIAQHAAETCKKLLSGDQKRAAAILFISILNRYIGELLFHTEKCDLSDVAPAKLRDVVLYAADQAIRASGAVWNVGQKPKVGAVEGGMKVAIWELKE